MKRHMFATALAAIAFATPSTPALAQEIEGLQVAPQGTVLSINTVGRSSQKPDLAMFSAGVATTGKTAKEALSANSAAMNRVIRALRTSGIAERDIQTSNLSISPVYANRNRTMNELEQQVPPIIGYRANNQVAVKQRKLDEFGKTIDTLVSAGANQVNGPSFQVEDVDTALDGARKEAISEARKRAQLYAGAAGLRVKRVLTISESGGYSPRPMMARVAFDQAESTPVAAGEVELQVNVAVQYELAP